MSSEKTNQSWGGRFSEPVDAFVARFTASVDFDKRLYRHDIMGSIAHATMLAKVGVLTADERDAIEAGLKQIQAEIEAGQFDWRVDLEDVHMNIEARLTDRIGITGNVLLVNPEVPARSVKELVEVAKARGGTMNYASWGVASGGHLAMESLKQQTGMAISHVPYKTVSQIPTDLISGVVPVAWVVTPVTAVTAVRVRPVSMGPARW